MKKKPLRKVLDALGGLSFPNNFPDLLKDLSDEELKSVRKIVRFRTHNEAMENVEEEVWSRLSTATTGEGMESIFWIVKSAGYSDSFLESKLNPKLTIRQIKDVFVNATNKKVNSVLKLRLKNLFLDSSFRISKDEMKYLISNVATFGQDVDDAIYKYFSNRLQELPMDKMIQFFDLYFKNKEKES